MLVTMATPISSYVKDKNGIFTAHDDDFLVKGKILVFHQYLYDKKVFCSVQYNLPVAENVCNINLFYQTLLIV